MKKQLMVLAVLMLFVVPMVFAEAEVTAVTAVDAKPTLISNNAKAIVRPINAIYLKGNGMVIDSEDPMDFMHAHAVIGGVRVRSADCVTADVAEADEKCFVVKKLGILSLDDKKYRLRNIRVSSETISADIYDPALVSTSEEDAASNHVGSIVVDRYEKPGKDIWAGEMKLNGSLYNAYFIGVKREFTLSEAKDSIGDYCRKYPQEAACRNLNLCKNNPNDPKCNPIKENYCVNNAGDVRCRQVLKNICEDAPNSTHCRKIVVAGKPVIAIKANAVKVEETPTEKEDVETNPEENQSTLQIVVTDANKEDSNNENSAENPTGAAE